MSIIPTVKCRSVPEAVAFYTQVLDFEFVWGSAAADPAYCVLRRTGSELHLSSQPGDGIAGQSVIVRVPDVAACATRFRERGLPRSGKADSPVHQGVVEQSWGTKEFYVDDPSGNTLRFVQG